MVTRLMDLVVLLAEMTRKSDKSFRELDKELVHLGYSSEEIREAFHWVSNQWRRLDPRATRRAAIRVLSPWEEMVLDPEAYRYLLRLRNLGIVDDDQFERIMYRILPVRGERLGASDIKALAGSVIFDMGVDEFENEILDVLDDYNELT